MMIEYVQNDTAIFIISDSMTEIHRQSLAKPSCPSPSDLMALDLLDSDKPKPL